MILMIDNYDSFTYNLVQYLGECGENLKVFRNDEISIAQIKKLKPDRIVISPGPGSPKDAGISKQVIKRLGPHIPTLGVCLGHQCIAEVYGAKIIHADRIMHGKTSMIFHEGHAMFRGISNPFEATRYHSLVVQPNTVTSKLKVIARTDADEIMGIQHEDYPICGVQFHPESILTTDGKKLIRNFLETSS